MISAAALAMSTALAGFAYAAAPGGPTATDTISVVSPASTSAGHTDPNDAPDDSDGRVGGGHGADDVNDARDDSDGRVGGGHGADDSGSDDSGSGGHGSHDSGSDDSGSGGHGSDD
ncbi:MAG: hypothetical protein JWQ45_370 [Blastococcus sp.]|nr:hypothetical protein [Blastococcus sp.]